MSAAQLRPAFKKRPSPAEDSEEDNDRSSGPDIDSNEADNVSNTFRRLENIIGEVEQSGPQYAEVHQEVPAPEDNVADEGTKKKRKYEQRRKKQSLSISAKRDFNHVSTNTTVDTERPGAERNFTNFCYKILADPTPGDRDVQWSTYMSLMEKLGSAWIIRIESCHETWTDLSDEIMPAKDLSTGGAEFGCIWMLRMPISTEKKAQDKGILDNHYQNSTGEAVGVKAARTGQHMHKHPNHSGSWDCCVSQPAGVIWRTPDVNFSDAYSKFMFEPTSTSNNKLLVNKFGPFLRVTMDGASIADVNKSKTELSRMLLVWTIKLAKVTYDPSAIGKYTHTTHGRYLVRIPIVLDTSQSNSAPQIISPPNGIFDSDKLHMRLSFERQTSSFDTLVIRDFCWTFLDNSDRASHAEKTGPLGFMVTTPERIYTPTRIPFELTPMTSSYTAAALASQGDSISGLRTPTPGPNGIRAQHWLITLGCSVTDVGYKAVKLSQGIEAHRIYFEGDMHFDALPSELNKKSPTRQVLEGGHNSLVRTFSNLNQVNAELRDGIPINQVLAIVSVFVYGNGAQNSRPFYWRCFTNICGIARKTDPELYNSNRVIAEQMLEKLHKDACGKRKNHSAHYHYDIDASLLYAGSCNLAYHMNVGLDRPPARPQNITTGLGPQYNPAFARPIEENPDTEKARRQSTYAACYMNVPDFFPPKIVTVRKGSSVITRIDEDDSAVVIDAGANFSTKNVFSPERLIWGVKFSIVSHTAKTAKSPEQIGVPLLILNGEEYFSDRARWMKGLTRRQLVQRIINDTRSTRFSELLWSLNTLSIGPKGFESAWAIYCSFESAEAPPEVDGEKTLTKILDELDQIDVVKMRANVYESNTDLPAPQEYKLSPPSLAQFSNVAYSQTQHRGTLKENSKLIQLEGVYYEPAMSYIQAIIHNDIAKCRKIIKDLAHEDQQRTAIVLPGQTRTSPETAAKSLGEVKALFFVDCMRIGDFLFSDKICKIILGHMIEESQLYAPLIDKAALFDADGEISEFVVDIPCQEFYQKNFLARNIVCTSKPVVNNFSIFLAIEALSSVKSTDTENEKNASLYKRRGIEFVFAGLAALLGENPSLEQWILGEKLKAKEDQFEVYDEDIYQLLVKTITEYAKHNAAYLKEIRIPSHAESKCKSACHQEKPRTSGHGRKQKGKKKAKNSGHAGGDGEVEEPNDSSHEGDLDGIPNEWHGL